MAPDARIRSVSTLRAVRPARLGRAVFAIACAAGAASAVAAFARVPARPLQHVAAQTQRAAGYLGIEFHDLSDAEATALHEKGTRGVLIVAVDHDGPAGKAGLRAQDVIVAINGQVAASADMLKRLLHDAGAGVSVALSLVRQGRTMAVSAVLADRKDLETRAWKHVTTPPTPNVTDAADPVDSEEANAHYAEPPPPKNALLRGQAFIGTVLHGPYTGLELEAMTPQLAGFFGATDGHGLLVQSVAANSPAAEAGLLVGDVLVRADGVLLRSSSTWTRHLRGSKDTPIILTVLRDHQERQIILSLDPRKHSMLEWPRLF